MYPRVRRLDNLILTVTVLLVYCLSTCVQGEESSFPIDVKTMRILWYEETTGTNLALGKPCVYSPTPDYRLTVNENDPYELTDGKLSGTLTSDAIWFYETAVGWYDSPYVYISLDLEEVKSIEKVVIRLLGGKEQNMLAFPRRIEILLSDDGINYYKASEWQKTLPGEGAFQYLPEEGKHYVYPFSLDCGNRLARYVVVKMESGGFLFTDELAVMEGTYPGNAVVDGLKRIPFKPNSVFLFSESEKLWICNNLTIFDRVLFFDLREGLSPASIVFELPQGYELVKLYRGWSNYAEPIAYKKIASGGKIFNQYTVNIDKPKPYEDIRFLITTNLPSGNVEEAFVYAKWQGGEQEKIPVPIEAYTINPIEPPKRLHTSIAWMGEDYQQDWPNFFNVYRKLGFNAVPFFPRYGVKTDWLNQARANGFSVLYNESPMHQMLARYKHEEEIYVLKADGTRGDQVSLAYRGQFYQKEMQRIAQLSSEVQPDWIFFDLELFVSYLRVAASQDQQLMQRMAQEGWTSIEEACIELATEMATDITNAAIAWAPEGKKPKVGFYNVKPPAPYGGIHDFFKLYPEVIDLAQPSQYIAGDAAKGGDQIRLIREHLPKSDIIPWLTAGTYGEFPSHIMRDLVLEAFFNGSCGITFYIIYDFNGLDLKYTSEAIAIAAKVEDVIMDGELIDTNEFTAPEGVRVTGLRKENGEAAILVSDYTKKNAGVAIGVSYNVSAPAQVIDLDDDTIVATITPEKPKFCLTLTENIRSKAFLISPLK